MPTYIIDNSSASTDAIAAPGAGKFIRVYNMLITALAATTVSIKDTDGTAVSGPLYCTQSVSGGVAMASIPAAGGLVDLLPNKGLRITNSGSVAIGGFINYSIMG